MLELSQVARVSRLELAQFELYSARVKEFSVHGRQSHPRTDGFGTDYARTLNSTQWKLLGSFMGERGATSMGGAAAAIAPACSTCLCPGLTSHPLRLPAPACSREGQGRAAVRPGAPALGALPAAALCVPARP